MADKRISQLVDRGTIANNDVVPIVVSGATTTNKATISSIQTFMQGNLDLGVTSVGITIGSTGTDVSVSGSPVTSSGNITINLPTASATNRGLLSAADWTTFNNKANAGDYVTLATTQTITAQKTFTTSGSSDTMIISHGSGSGFALDVLKAGNGEAIRVTKSSGTGNAMTISGGNFEAGTIVKTGGTSSQFLKADGSVDSNTYLTTGSAGSTYVPYSGASANVDLGIYSFTSNTITSQGGMTVNGGGSNAGQIHFKSNAIFSLLNGYGTIASGTSNSFLFYQTNNVGDFRGANLNLNSITASATRTYTLPDASGTLALSTDLGAYLPLSGGTLTGALNGTSASFTKSSNSGSGSDFPRLSVKNTLATQGDGSSTFNFADINISSGNDAVNMFLATTFAAGTWAPAGIINVATNHELQLKTNNTTRLTIASTGAATFSSSVTLQNAGELRVYRSDNTRYGGFFTDGLAVHLTSSNDPIRISSADRTEFYNSGSERMRITSGGNVMINKISSPGNTMLDIVNSSGNSSINSRVSLNGDNAINWFNASGTYICSIVVNASSVAYNTSSDYRLKENVKPVQGALSKLSELKPCTFNFIADAEEEVIGFLAHEVQEVIPQAVTGQKDAVKIEKVEVSPAELDEEGNVITEPVIEEQEVPVYQGIDHSKLVPLLVAAIQELKTEIDSLKNQMQ